jgi:hypothetical protein
MADRPHNPYDIASKMVVDSDPVAFARLCGPADSVELLDTNFASNIYADRLLKVRYGDSVFLRHVEVQSGYDKTKLADAAHYATGAFRAHRLEVFSLFVLLHRGADGPLMTGKYSTGSSTFGFDVLRMWEFSAEMFLNGPLAHVPLVALCDVPEPDLPGVVDRMRRRIVSEPSDINPVSLWSEFDLFLGFKYPPDFISSLLKGVGDMMESSTFRALIEEGEARGIARGKAIGAAETKRETILRLGSKRLGDPDAATRAIINQIESLERLDGLLDRVIEVESWNELMGH